MAVGPSRILIGVLAILVVSSRICAAQSPPAASPSFTKLGASAGIQRYVPGTWGIVKAELLNSTDHSVDLLAATYFAGEPEVLYARQAWLPAGTRRTIWYPIQVPPQELREATTSELKSLLYDRSHGGEQLLKPPSGQRLYSEQATLDPGRSLTGYYSGPGITPSPYDPPVVLPDDISYEASVAIRLGVKLSPHIVTLRPEQYPPTVEGLNGLTNIVIANDAIDADVAAMAALRQWLHQGGRLWIQLDRVSPSTISQLLGIEFGCQVIDRVGLNEFEIRDVSSATSKFNVSVEQPVDFVRVIPERVDIAHEINGWPASFWLKYGRGTVLVTTLAPEGWIRQRTTEDTRTRRTLHEESNNTKYVPLEPLEKLAARFFQPVPEPPISADKLRAMSNDQVGYRIVGRGTVTALLAVFCVGFGVVGTWLARKERSEMLGWLGPAGALGTAVVLVVLGTSARQAIPYTVAMTQYIESIAGTGDVLVTGTAALYSPDIQTNVNLGTKHGGSLIPADAGARGQTRRIVMTDIDSSHWEQLGLPAGVSSFVFTSQDSLKKPIQVAGTFGPQGFETGCDLGPLSNPEDALVVTGLGRRASATIEAGGKALVRVSDVLPPEQFLSSTFMSDLQQHRMAVFRDLLTDGQFARQIDRPTMLVWTSPLEGEFLLPETMEVKGAALVAVPIQVKRPAPGTDVVIPSAFLAVRDVDGPAQLAGSRQSFSFRDGKWAELPTGARTWLRFELPREVVPMQVTKAVLNVRLNAPERFLEVEGMAGANPVSFGRHNNPIGSFSFNIDRPEVLQLDEFGGLTFSVNVGDLKSEAPRPSLDGGPENRWKIDFVTLDVFGKTPSQ